MIFSFNDGTIGTNVKTKVRFEWFLVLSFEIF